MKTIKHWLAFLAVAIMVSFGLSACSKEDVNKEVVTNEGGLEKLVLNYQGTNSFVTYPELAEDLGYLGPIKLNYLGSIIGGPQDLQSLATGDVDFATAFNGAIIK
ncbi:MAG TPA: hypothetical protein PK342_11285, partial [Methylotenera sp.]|nr:hypothetical protein [Methylotenera sp.]